MKINQIKKYFKNNKYEKIGQILMALGILINTSTLVYGASADTSSINQLIYWIAEWVGKIGLAVAFFGAVQTAFGFKNEDADAKTRGLRTVASGFMVFGITKAFDLFGL